MRRSLGKIVWVLYCAGVFCILGYFSLLLGTFATDAPSSTVLGGIVVGSMIFLVGVTLFIWIPFKIYKRVKKRKI